MYKIMKMKMNSVIKNGDEKSSVIIEGNGTILNKDIWTTCIYMDSNDEHYEIEIGDQVTLKRNDSILRFKRYEYVNNQYKTPYGYMNIETYLERADLNDRSLKLVYHLCQNKEIVSKVYIQISFLK